MLELSTNPNITLAPTCPICHGVGQKVRKITVVHQVKQGSETGLTERVEIKWYNRKRTLMQIINV